MRVFPLAMKKRYSHIHIETLREAVAQIGPKKPAKAAAKSAEPNVVEPGQDFNKAAQDLLSALAMLLKTRA
jgi:hypothetical protein